ncbi:tyrosine-type recombinase/integrase [Marinivivus vitaminiproducens]|uniref:tyrosine-type recombinase/integrase n=1 Tax=Marinivivus vitaminiproducens TaxID=3035935 RepID=UPI003FA145C9
MKRFVAFMEERGEAVITARLAVEWAGSLCGPATWSSRLATVRAFARHLALTDPRTEIPPSGVFAPQRRPRPFIYTDAQITDLMASMAELHPTGLQARTYQCFFGLIASSGLRFSEAANLLRTEVDLAVGVITICESKFGKSRVIPVHETTADALRRYASERDRCARRQASAYFFTGDRGAKLNHTNAHKTFIDWTRLAGLRRPGESAGPRIHDLRHTFAVRILTSWHAAGEDIERRLPELTTYLGHAHSEDTYWYLSACPELLDHARARLEARWETAA